MQNTVLKTISFPRYPKFNITMICDYLPQKFYLVYKEKYLMEGWHSSLNSDAVGGTPNFL